VITQKRLSEQIQLYKKNCVHRTKKEAAIIHELLKLGIISEKQNITGNILVYIINGKPKYSAKEIVCSIFPYGYLSHISAMEWYGITDKIPKVIRFTCCSPEAWKIKAIAELQARWQESYKTRFIPIYPKSIQIEHEQLLITSETHYSEPIQIKNSPLRVASIGRTFIDMLRKPEFCGGEEHVLEVYQEQGVKYAKLIIQALQKEGTAIDKARVGFVLDKILGFKNSQLTEWKNESQQVRGSSKKLIYSNELSKVFDEDWSLNINSELAQQYVAKS